MAHLTVIRRRTWRPVRDALVLHETELRLSHSPKKVSQVMVAGPLLPCHAAQTLHSTWPSLFLNAVGLFSPFDSRADHSQRRMQWEPGPSQTPVSMTPSDTGFCFKTKSLKNWHMIKLWSTYIPPKGSWRLPKGAEECLQNKIWFQVMSKSIRTPSNHPSICLPLPNLSYISMCYQRLHRFYEAEKIWKFYLPPSKGILCDFKKSQRLTLPLISLNHWSLGECWEWFRIPLISRVLHLLPALEYSNFSLTLTTVSRSKTPPIQGTDDKKLRMRQPVWWLFTKGHKSRPCLEHHGINEQRWLTFPQVGTLTIKEWVSSAFPGGSVVKNMPANTGLIPGSGRSTGKGNNNPL